MGGFRSMLTILLLSLAYQCITCVNEVLKIRSTPTGFTYANRLAEKMISFEAARSKIPDVKAPIRGGPGSGEFQLTNINLSKFMPPRLDYKLGRPNNVQWKTTGGHVQVNADWKAYYRILLKVQTSGEIVVTASDIELDIDATLSEGNQRLPKVSINSCTANIGSLDTKIKGSSIVQWIINLFRYDIAAKVRKSIIENVCASGKVVLQNYVNAKIQTLPTKIPVYQNFILDYGLAGNPAVTDGNLDVPVSAVISWNSETTPILPINLPSFEMSSTPQKMLYILASDYIINSLLYSAHKHKAISFVVDNTTSKTLASFLHTDCGWSVCISDFIPGLYSKYPNSQVELIIHTSVAPSVQIQSGNAVFNASFYLDVYVAPWKITNTMALRMEQDLYGLLKISVNESQVLGQINITKSEMNLVETSVGPIADGDLKLFEDFALPVLETMVNQKLKKGLSIPSVTGVTFENSEVILRDRAAQIGLDINYTPGL